MITIKTIQIDQQPLTIKLFNQLYIGKCFDENYNIVCKIYGKVNYGGVTWVVFSDGDNIYKQNIYSIGKDFPNFDVWFIKNFEKKLFYNNVFYCIMHDARELLRYARNSNNISLAIKLQTCFDALMLNNIETDIIKHSIDMMKYFESLNPIQYEAYRSIYKNELLNRKPIDELYVKLNSVQQIFL